MMQGSSPDQQPNIDQKMHQEDSSLPIEGWPQSEASEFTFQSKVKLDDIEDKITHSIPTCVTDTSHTVSSKIYHDKHGLPVIYDAATQEQKKQKEVDSISVLWHELLTPLTIIKGYTSTLTQFKDDITEEDKTKYIQGIESACNRMVRLLENLRDVSRLEETDNFITRRISIIDLLHSVIPQMQSQTTNHVIKIRPSGRVPLVNADPERIEQVISNLLTNAIKYSPQGGDIEAEIHVVKNEQELRRMLGDTPPIKLPSLVVSIVDNGIGIPMAELDRIFDRFFRVKNKLTKNTPGAGLGLYIAKTIVESHDGHIWARNRLQGGSTFSFSLPLE